MKYDVRIKINTRRLELVCALKLFKCFKSRTPISLIADM
jgi:hypothetical protein